MEAMDGYKITDHDPHVATVGFLHTLSTHMMRQLPVRSAMRQGEAIFDMINMAGPKDRGHFEAAVRTIPDGYLSAVGRS